MRENCKYGSGREEAGDRLLTFIGRGLTVRTSLGEGVAGNLSRGRQPAVQLPMSRIGATRITSLYVNFRKQPLSLHKPLEDYLARPDS